MSENKRYDYYLEKTLDKIFDVNSTANPKTSIISERFHARLNNFFDGYKLVQNDLKMYNYRDYKGRLLSDDWFDRGYEFKNGYAIIGKYMEDSNSIKENIIDRDGNIVCDKWFDFISYFDGKITGYNFFDEDTRDKYVNSRNDEARFHASIINVYASDTTSSEVLVDFRGKDVEKDYKIVEINGKYNFRKPNRHLLLKENVDEVKPFSDGYALVKNNGKYNIVDVNGDYVSKNEWFDAITDYCWYNRLDFVKGRGYVIVFKKIDKVMHYNIMDLKGNLLIDWTPVIRALNPYYDDAQLSAIRYIDLKGYTYKKVGLSYVLSKGSEEIQLKYRPLRVYDNFVLCVKTKYNMLYGETLYYYYLIDKKTKKRYKVGCNRAFSQGPDDYGNYNRCCFAFDDNFIHDSFHKKTYLIYGPQIIDITDYFNRKLINKRTVTVNKSVERIIPLKEFNLTNTSSIDKVLKEDEEREKIRQTIYDKDRKTREIGELLNRYKNDEEGIKKVIEVVEGDLDEDFERVDEKIELLYQLRQKGAKLAKLTFNEWYLFKKVDNHYEFRNSVIKNERLHMFKTAGETFENVKMDNLYIEGCDLSGLEPTKVFNRNMSHSSFIKVHFDPLKSWAGVNIIGCTFTDDEDPLTVKIMPAFEDAIYDDTTTYNGIPLTTLIKRERMQLQEDMVGAQEEYIGPRSSHI